MTTCDDLAARVVDDAFDLLDPDEAAGVSEHLAGCAPCRALREEATGCRGALALPDVAPRDGVWSELAARIEADASPAPDAAPRGGAGDELTARTDAEAPPAPDACRCDAADERPDARAGDGPAPGPELRVTLRCVYCHDAATREDDCVYCAACLAPHHEGCFHARGTCSAPGCAETAVVQARATKPASPRQPASRRRRRRPALVAAGAAALAGAAIAAATQLSGDPPETDRPAPVASATEAEPTGPRTVSLDYERADLRAVISDLAARADREIVVGPDVEGEVTVQLDAVHPLEALFRTVAEAGDVAIVLGEGGALRIVAADALAGLETRTFPARLAPDDARRILPRLKEIVAGEEKATVAYLEDADLYAGTASADALQRVQAVLEREREALERYRRAEGVVSTRNVHHYERTKRLLEAIPPDTLMYPDAQAYLDWIEADRQVREARAAYDAGDAERAFQLLAEALQHDVLGPGARASVRTRREKWGRVVRSFERGLEHSRAGRYDAAEAALERVLELEPERSNRFCALAEKQLAHMRQPMATEVRSVARLLREGREALGEGDRARALQRFARARERDDFGPDDRRAVTQAVADAERRERLVAGCEAVVRADRQERLLDAYSTLRLLDAWLPPDHPRREDVGPLLETVRTRLNEIMEQAQDAAPATDER